MPYIGSDYLAENIISIILLIPVYVLLVFSYLYPEESFMLGKRWQFSEEPHASEMAIQFIKYSSEFVLAVLTTIILLVLFSNVIIRLVFFAVLMLYIITRGIQLMLMKK